MKRTMAIALAAVLGGCQDLPPDRTLETDEVRKAFVAWAGACVKGEGEGNLRHI